MSDTLLAAICHLLQRISAQLDDLTCTSKGGAYGEAMEIAAKAPRRNRPEPRPRQSYSPGFEQFWAAWKASPRKVSKKTCFDVWKRRGFEKAAEAIAAHAAACWTLQSWIDGYDPAPLTYLRQERFSDPVTHREKR